ncbi:MAG: ornithine carbamoyltransferase [Opitutaceae bacterium]|jgi:ornithine carbamoyltransferase
MRHFLQETDFKPREIGEVFTLARKYKQQRGRRGPQPLAGQTWALIFSKSSTRTRVSFEVGIRELGGNPLFLNRSDIQLDRGETIEDTAKVLSRYVHGLIVRTYDHRDVKRLASAGSIPVINALTDFLHPCQMYTDAFTLAERWGGKRGNLLASLKGRKIAFLGDTACNVSNSWIIGANLLGMKIALSGPKGYAPGPNIEMALADSGLPSGGFQFTTDPYEAVHDADVVYTDVWVSMGKEEEEKRRLKRLAPYSVTTDLFAAAKPGAFFMHCLPAHPGEEVTQEVLDNPCSIIFDQAENRLHMQKAIMTVLAAAARRK